MPGPRHDPPQHRDAFRLTRSGAQLLVDAVPVVARAVARDGAAGFDVLDEHAESIGFFEVEGAAVRLSVPHGLGAQGALDAAAGRLDLDEDGRAVLRARRRDGGVEVEAPDPRVDLRVAAALVDAILLDGTEED